MVTATQPVIKINDHWLFDTNTYKGLKVIKDKQGEVERFEEAFRVELDDILGTTVSYTDTEAEVPLGILRKALYVVKLIEENQLRFKEGQKYELLRSRKKS